MYKLKSIILCSVIALSAINASALEVKDIIKGSFRNYYSTAIIVDTDLGQTAYDSSKDYTTTFNEETTRAKKVYNNHARSLCTGKSTYAVVSDYEAHTAFATNGNIFVTTDANVICFNLPSK